MGEAGKHLCDSLGKHGGCVLGGILSVEIAKLVAYAFCCQKVFLVGRGRWRFLRRPCCIQYHSAVKPYSTTASTQIVAAVIPPVFFEITGSGPRRLNTPVKRPL